MVGVGGREGEEMGRWDGCHVDGEMERLKGWKVGAYSSEKKRKQRSRHCKIEICNH